MSLSCFPGKWFELGSRCTCWAEWFQKSRYTAETPVIKTICLLRRSQCDDDDDGDGDGDGGHSDYGDDEDDFFTNQD